MQLEVARKCKRILKRGVIVQPGKRGTPLLDPQACSNKWVKLDRPARREKDHYEILASFACSVAVAACESGTPRPNFDLHPKYGH